MSKKFNFAEVENTPIAQTATETMAKAFEAKPSEDLNVTTKNGTTEVTFNQPNQEGRVEVPANTQHPTPTTPSVMTSIEHLAARRLQIQSEFHDAAIQALSLKTFPEAGNWKLEECVRKFNLNKAPGTPKLTKGALAEMILLDAVDELYNKVCK